MPALVLAAGFLVVQPSYAEAGVLAQFGFTGEQQTWTVPAGVSEVRIYAVGSGGGGLTPGTPDPVTGALPADGPLSVAGLGAMVAVELPVSPGEVLSVNVGGEGGSGNSTGGYGGGGNGNGGSGGGGGASQVSRGQEPLVVAGGGGGAGSGAALDYAQGGSGGGIASAAEGGEAGLESGGFPGASAGGGGEGATPTSGGGGGRSDSQPAIHG